MREAKQEGEPLKVKGCLKWFVIIAVVLGVTVFFFFQRNEKRIREEMERVRHYESKVDYDFSIFPARITFQRGRPSQVSYVGASPFRGQAGEYATCPDDSEGTEIAEFYLAADPDVLLKQPYADATHPIISSKLEYILDASPAELFKSAVVMQETQFDGWKLRSTLIPTPFGGSVIPDGVPADALAALPENTASEPEKGEVDARLSSGFGTGVNRVDQRRKAEERLERQHSESLSLYDDHHHHCYVVEAVKDFGDGRVVILRRYGKVYGVRTVADAEEIIRTLASKVEIPLTGSHSSEEKAN